MRRDEVKAAFMEGAQIAAKVAEQGLAHEESMEMDSFQLEEAWRRSDARKRLEKPLAD